MTGAQIGISASVMATAGVGLTETWQAWEKIGLAGILLVAVAVLYRAGERNRERHEALLRDVIEKMSTATQRSADAIVASTEALRNVEIIVQHCRDRANGNGGVKP